MTDVRSTPPRLAWPAPDGADADDLPHPARQRWQPTRLGLVDLFYYDDEQFWFHDGRLLLRGNNGTGKSKVLALTLPFVLDGSVHPRRVEPDADPKKRMEWNLLLGGAHPASERTGYSWVEFGRRDDDGREQFTTLGIGVKAAAGRGIVKSWYFVTSRRVGDLRLVDDNRIVLTQERLRDELAASGDGQVFTSQESYRRAVDEALFRLGEQRYAALVDLLIQLRQPQLSKKPDEKALSAALTEALSPLDQAVVADVAESFRSLEDEREGIAEAKETLRASEDFLRHYRVYARVASRRHTTAVRESNSEYERAGRDLREAEAALQQVDDRIVRLESDKQEADERHSTLQGQDRALRESPEMRNAERLDRAGRDAKEARQRADSAQQEADRARGRAEHDRAHAADAANRSQEAADEHQHRAAAAERLAAPAGLADEHPQLIESEDEARRAITRRREQVEHVRRLVQTALRARDRAERQRIALDAAEADATGRAEEVDEAETVIESAVTDHLSAVRSYVAGLRTLTIAAEIDELIGRAAEWARNQDGRSPARTEVAEALDAAQDRLGRERAAAEQDRDRAEQELAAVCAEIAELEAGHDPEPPSTPARDTAARTGRPGAPLWRLADFGDAVPDADRAGLEAALESAGLLDAWVFPDGTVQADGDVILGPHGPQVTDALDAVLVPAVGPDAPVPAEAVVAALRRIGLGESTGAALWVDRDGRWGAGPARGSWSKSVPEYVGAGARAATRQARLEALRGTATEIDGRRVAAAARVTAVDERIGTAREESAGYPDGTERQLVQAHTVAGTAQRELARARAAVAAAQTRWSAAEEAVAAAEDELTEQAGQLRLGTTAAELDVVWSATHDYAQSLSEARSAARAVDEREQIRQQTLERADESGQLLRQRVDELAELRQRAATLGAQFEELHATVAASVSELQQRLGRVADQLVAVSELLTTIGRDQLSAAAEQGTLREKVKSLTEWRAATAATREHTVRALRTFAATGLLRVALPELEAPDTSQDEVWNVTAALALSRQAEQEFEDTDDSADAWARSQQRMSNAATELTSQMSRHGHTAYIEQHDDVLVARVRYQRDEVDIDHLATRLAQDVADREHLLSAREREILENHLVNEVAGHLHELLLAAESQIGRMNRELAARKTSTGMQLRVRWRERADSPAGLRSARALMLRSDATWTAADRTAIGGFLQARISDVRQADPTGSWQEHLEQALDYRHWHTFTVERLQNGQWRSASGPASGGEKALAVSVPLFAAASAHYNSAAALAPRLILLDEAFAGVDDDSRAKSLGLLATFDLDVVMTSEREWACYPQVPGLSIAQLSRVDGVDAVGVTRWRWDGVRRERMAEIASDARAAAGPVQQHDSLFD